MFAEQWGYLTSDSARDATVVLPNGGGVGGSWEGGSMFAGSHDKLLSDGALPLDILGTEMGRWLETEAKGSMALL